MTNSASLIVHVHMSTMSHVILKQAMHMSTNTSMSLRIHNAQTCMQLLPAESFADLQATATAALHAIVTLQFLAQNG